MLKEHPMYELRISTLGSGYKLQATDSGRVEAEREYESLSDLLRKLSGLGVDVTELVIPPATTPGEPQDILLRDYRFRGSVLSEVLGVSESR
jgi:hypothetical protein